MTKMTKQDLARGSLGDEYKALKDTPARYANLRDGDLMLTQDDDPIPLATSTDALICALAVAGIIGLALLVRGLSIIVHGAAL